MKEIRFEFITSDADAVRDLLNRTNEREWEGFPPGTCLFVSAFSVERPQLGTYRYKVLVKVRRVGWKVQMSLYRTGSLRYEAAKALGKPVMEWVAIYGVADFTGTIPGEVINWIESEVADNYDYPGKIPNDTRIELF